MQPDTAEKTWRHVLSRLHRASRAKSFPGAANALFGGLADATDESFHDLEDNLKEANINVLFRTYISQIYATTALATVAGLGITLMIALILQPPALLTAALVFGLPTLFGAIAFGSMYFYPFWKAKKRSASIKMNLPFALNHMSAVAGSGVPPSAMFNLLINFDEYGEISKEAEKIVTKVHAFGEDVTTAIRETAKETPSEDFREILFGIVSTIETGGSLQMFLEESAARTLFDYRIERQKQIERLTTFASFYTALLVAAPLFLITILAVLEVIGGELFGMPIKATCGIIGALMGECPLGAIDIGAFFVIPIANALFIIVLEVTQPEV